MVFLTHKFRKKAGKILGSNFGLGARNAHPKFFLPPRPPSGEPGWVRMLEKNIFLQKIDENFCRQGGRIWV